MQLIPTILCGGSGSRLWPVSRELHPKPFIRLKDGLSLLQKAFLRSTSLCGVEEVLTVTNRELFFKIKEEFDEINQDHIFTSFILEPVARNTAAAITVAALQIVKHHGEDTLMLVLASDHLIGDQTAFQQAVTDAADLALTGKLMTLGVRPHEPHTGYGYIETDGNKVLRFVEKPTLAMAEAYLSTNLFLWNSGIFLFTAKAILNAMNEYCPEILTAIKKCLDVSTEVVENSGRKLILDTNSFARVPEDSIDYAVMEKSKQIGVVSCDIGWSDVGSWCALGEQIEADENGNRINGEACLHDVTNCYIQSSGRLIGGVGIDNLFIIDTPDALLVADQARAQDVKHIYSKLKKQGHDVHKLHRTVYRPWGNYTVLEESRHFKIKRIVVKSGESLSLQMHHHRSEHWVVVSGIAKVFINEKMFYVKVNESTYIPARHKHRLENPGLLDLVIIEVQSGEYLGEDDIVRFEDNYGRVEVSVT